MLPSMTAGDRSDRKISINTTNQLPADAIWKVVIQSKFVELVSCVLHTEV